jgi:stage II sporulation protein M
MNQITRLLKRDWPYFSALAALFVLSVLIGRYLPDFAPKVANTIKEQALGDLSQIAKLIKEAGLPTQIFIIWLNNVLTSCVAIFAGIIFFLPFLSLGFLIFNGLVIGLVQQIAEANGMNVVKFYLLLIPHGIFEIPAFIIAVYLGARFSLIPYRLVWHYFRTRQYRPLLKEYLHDFKYYGILFVVILTIAAVVEMAVTPLLINL